MTKEQYNRAIEIDARLNALERVRRDANRRNAKPLLSFSIVYGEDDATISAKHSDNIKDILERHAAQILDEVDAEIASLEKEIEIL